MGSKKIAFAIFTPFLILPSGAHKVGVNELKGNGSMRIS
jgi:hypothetical protein